MPFWVWLALAVSLAVALGAIAYVALRALALWRQVKATELELTSELERVSASAEALGARAEGLEGSVEKLEPSLARLATSRAQLQILLAAWGEATQPWRSARSYVPPEKKA
jgi:hypothetical protein